MTMRGAPATVALILSMVAIELLLQLSPELRGWAYDQFAFATLVEGGRAYATLSWPILTHAALHGGLLHIGFNMAALAAFGPPVERSLGSSQYLLVFVIAAAAGAMAHFGWIAALTAMETPPQTPITVLVGASGAISGVLALEFFRRAAILKAVPAEHRRVSPGGYLRSVSITFIAINLVITLLPGFISGEAHIGGFLVGLLAGPLLMRRISD